ncbi:MAG: hypothetical protein ACREAC_18230, partial [Blastocatellia bacterium]
MKPRTYSLAFALALSLFAANLPVRAVGAAGTFQQDQPVADGDLTPKLAKMEAEIEAKRKETGVPGLSVAIIKDDKLIFAKGFGLRDIEHGL